MPQFTGIGTALVTPFKDSEVDFAALGKIIEHSILGKVDYLVSLGTTGESVTLDENEQRAIVDFTLQQIDGRVPLVVGFGGNDTRALKKRIASFDMTGIAGILSSSPAYNKPGQEGIYQHYMSIAEASDLPFIIYNVPGRTSSNVLPSTILRLAEEKPFVAVKEASGSMDQATAIAKGKNADFTLLSGDDPTAISFMALGGQGLISVISNAYPAHFAEMIHLCQSGAFEAAQAIHNKLYDLHDWLYAEGNPTGIKAACAHLGLCEDAVRLPLVSMTPAGKDQLTAIMEGIR